MIQNLRMSGVPFRIAVASAPAQFRLVNGCHPAHHIVDGRPQCIRTGLLLDSHPHSIHPEENDRSSRSTHGHSVSSGHQLVRLRRFRSGRASRLFTIRRILLPDSHRAGRIHPTESSASDHPSDGGHFVRPELANGDAQRRLAERGASLPIRRRNQSAQR